MALCTTADEGERQSYVNNMWLWAREIRYHSRNTGRVPASEIVVIGENKRVTDYLYLPMDLWSDVEYFEANRHGPALRSNYLWLDMHVSNDVPARRPGAYSAWDVANDRW
jgi:hypothetical protein